MGRAAATKGLLKTGEEACAGGGPDRTKASRVALCRSPWICVRSGYNKEATRNDVRVEEARVFLHVFLCIYQYTSTVEGTYIVISQ